MSGPIVVGADGIRSADYMLSLFVGANGSLAPMIEVAATDDEGSLVAVIKLTKHFSLLSRKESLLTTPPSSGMTPLSMLSSSLSARV